MINMIDVTNMLKDGTLYFATRIHRKITKDKIKRMKAGRFTAMFGNIPREQREKAVEFLKELGFLMDAKIDTGYNNTWRIDYYFDI